MALKLHSYEEPRYLTKGIKNTNYMEQLYKQIETLFKDFEMESHTLGPRDWHKVKTRVETFKAIFNVFIACSDQAVREFGTEAKELLGWIERRLNPDEVDPYDHQLFWSDL